MQQENKKKEEKKPCIAIVGDLPGWYFDQSIAKLSWHYAPWLVSLTEAFERNDDFEIHWFSFTRGIYREHRLHKGNQTFHFLPCLPMSVSARLRFMPESLMLRMLMSQLKPDLVHAWGTESRNGFAVSRLPYKKVLSVQGCMTAMLHQGEQGAFVRQQGRYEARIMQSFDRLTCESPWCRDWVQRIAPTVPITLWEYAVEKRFWEISRHPDPTPMCLMGCMPAPLKNVETAVSAFSSPALSHVRLLLAGIPEGTYPNLPSNIKELGGVGRDAMVDLMSCAWALVHPSLVDTGPTVAKEARVMGLPLIISDCCGCQQYVENGKSGYVIPPRDAEALVQAVVSVTADVETSLRMGAHGLSECRRRLSHDTMAEKLVELYRMMLNHSSSLPSA